LGVQKNHPNGGRPRQVAEFAVGKEAASNFVGAMRQILSGQKTVTHQVGSGFQKRHKLGR
jgi:hypothetical protein